MMLYPLHQSFDVLILSDALYIADEDKHSASPSDCYIHPAPIPQKANVSFVVATNHG